MILGFDTSAAHCAAALLRGDKIIARAHEPMAKGQAERLMVLVQDLLDQSGTALSDLDAIGVGIGPGNFTGIRIAVSAARGLALGLSIPAVGVSAFDALRYGTQAPCLCAVDARRDMVFVQGFNTPAYQSPSLQPMSVLATSDAPVIGAFGAAPVHFVADAIAHLCLERYAQTTTRPSPLYIRPADAAPARDAPPRILV